MSIDQSGLGYNSATNTLSVTASFATSASYSLSGSFAQTASFVTTAQTASYVLNAVSASYSLSGSFAQSSSFAQTASFVTTAQTASYVVNAISASYAATSSYATTFTISASVITTAVIASSGVGSNIVFNQPSGSYSAAFYKYSVANGGNSRIGEVYASFNAGAVVYTDFSTIDNGSTTAVTMSAATTAGGNIQLLAQTNASGWTIKSQATYL